VYEIECLVDHVAEAVAAVGEVICSPPPSLHTIAETKDTCQIKIDAHKACGTSQLVDLLHEAAYGENTPLGSSMFGSSLDKLEVETILSFRKSNYLTSNLVVSASGIAHDTLKSLVECHLSALPSAPSSSSASSSALPASPYIGGDIKVRVDLDGVSHVGVAFPVPAGAAALPYKVLFATLESKIAHSTSIPKGSLTPFISTYTSGGLIGFTAHGSAAAATGFLEAGVAELKALASAGSASSVAKVSLEGVLALEGEDSADALLSASVASLSPVAFADVRSLTAADVSNAAKAALAAAPAFAVYGQTAGTPSYATIAKLIK